MTGYGKRMAALLAAWLALAALAGCARRDPAGGARKDTDSGHVSAGDATGAPEPGEGIGSGDGDLRTYYEERIEEMKQTLLNERQERYISEYEYRERLAKLEQELRLLTAGAELDTARQVAGQPASPPHARAGCPTDAAAFRQLPVQHTGRAGDRDRVSGRRRNGGCPGGNWRLSGRGNRGRSLPGCGHYGGDPAGHGGNGRLVCLRGLHRAGQHDSARLGAEHFLRRLRELHKADCSVRAGFLRGALGGKLRTSGTVHMNTTDGGLPPLSLKQAPTCSALFQNRENKRIPENSGVFYIFF